MGNIRQNEVQLFLRFPTGSSMCLSKSLLVNFNNEEGLDRCPIAHTCCFTLELSTAYNNYADFAGEFLSILINPDGEMWKMDAL